MDRFNLPQSTIDFISQFQKQLKGLIFIHKFLQVIVGGILPIIEAIIVNRATDSTNQNTSYFWILLVIIGFIHLVFLIILVSTDTPLPQFLIEFDQLTDELAYAEESQAVLELYNNTLRSAIIATHLSLIGIERIEQEKIQEADKKIEIILDPWIQNRSNIFWFQDGDAMYNFAVYSENSNGESVCEFRQCDDRIKRIDRPWKKGVGHIGICFAREETQFCQDAASASPTTNEQVARPEDNSYYRSIIAEPIMVNSKVNGVFIVTSSQADQFQEDIHIPCVRVIVRLLAGLNLSVPKSSQNP